MQKINFTSDCNVKEQLPDDLGIVLKKGLKKRIFINSLFIFVFLSQKISQSTEIIDAVVKI